MIFYRFFRTRVETLVIEMEQQAIKLVEVVAWGAPVMDAPRKFILRASATRIACLPRFRAIAASRARSLLAYLCDMSRRSLRGSLRFIPQK